MKYLLSLDQGTTSSRAILFSPKREILAIGQKEFNQFFPHSGWVEHDPEEILSSQLEAVDLALKQANATAQDIIAIGITNQRETTVLWNKETSKPIYPAIVWQDRRTEKLCQELKSRGLEDSIRNKTGLLLDPYFSATKIRWMLNHVPEAKQLADEGKLAFGTVDSWLIWRLTNGASHVTDATNASRTLLFNIHTKEWDDELLKLFDIPRSILPKVVSCAEICGHFKMGDCSIPIAGIAGDQQASLIGHECHHLGQVKCTYGTGAFLLTNTQDKAILSKHHLLTTIAYQIGSKTYYALEGSVFNCGSVLNWLKDSLNIFPSSQEIDHLALQTPTSKDVVFVSALTGLGAPYWEAKATGMILGLTRGTSKNEIARAALESIALQIYELIECIKQDLSLDLQDIHVDGGVSKSDLMLQIQANLSQLPIKRASFPEMTAWGAALLAGIGVGLWKDLENTPSFANKDLTTFSPLEKAEQDLLKKWRKAILLTLNWANPNE